MIQLIREVLANKAFAYRGDYEQLLRLVLILLTGHTEGFKFTKPGAISKARWMAKSIVGCGLCLLKDQIFAEIGNRIMTPQQAVLIEVCEVFSAGVCEVVGEVSSGVCEWVGGLRTTAGHQGFP